MTVQVGLTMFWSTFAGQFGCGQFRLKNLVLVDFGPQKMVFVIFDWKHWVLPEKIGFRPF